MKKPNAPPTIKPNTLAINDNGPKDKNIDWTNIEKKIALQIRTPALNMISVFLKVKSSELFSIFVMSNNTIPAIVNIMQYPKSLKNPYLTAKDLSKMKNGVKLYKISFDANVTPVSKNISNIITSPTGIKVNTYPQNKVANLLPNNIHITVK